MKSGRLVEIERGRGIVVRALSSNDMREICQAITGMEVMAVFLLTESSAGRATLEPLFTALRWLDEASRRTDLELWGKADEAFHRSLLRLSSNVHIERVGLPFRDLAQRAHRVAMRVQPTDHLARSVEMHRALVELIVAGDAEAAVGGAANGALGLRTTWRATSRTWGRTRRHARPRLHRFSSGLSWLRTRIC